ncbi:amphiphysin isoform X2 [Kryptolebias marmoratus]|uniref:amphiphysin isoform X2 n=1 Tax=Kryptolebias marmoratus TaxID=37003 RepID=UPI0007F89B8B|nr:amphiphysin isoform X2 [Kryptolebias marmoratus]
MAEIKTGIFAKNVQKRLNRAQEKVLQKLGKADETKDEQFEQVVVNFKRQESEGSRLQREMKAYMSAIKGMQQASINLTQSLHEVYEPDWHGKEDIVTIGKDCDALWEDFHNKLVDSTLLNLDAYLQEFPDLKMRVAKRSRKLIDYDSARHHLETLQVSGMKNDRKVMKAEEELKKAQKVFDELDVGLQDELPTLWDRRVGFYISTFKSVTTLEARFHREISQVCRELYEVMTKLGEQHSDKIFTIQGAPSDSGPLRLARTPSPPEDESPPESPDAGSNHMLRPISPGPPRPKSPTQLKKGPPVPPPPKVTPTKEVAEEQIIDLFGGEFLPAPSPSLPNERPGESLLDLDFDAFQPDESVSPIPQTAVPWDMWSANAEASQPVADAGFVADWSADFGSMPTNEDAAAQEVPAEELEGEHGSVQGVGQGWHQSESFQLGGNAITSSQDSEPKAVEDEVSSWETSFIHNIHNSAASKEETGWLDLDSDRSSQGDRRKSTPGLIFTNEFGEEIEDSTEDRGDKWSRSLDGSGSEYETAEEWGDGGQGGGWISADDELSFENQAPINTSEERHVAVGHSQTVEPVSPELDMGDKKDQHQQTDLTSDCSNYSETNLKSDLAGQEEKRDLSARTGNSNSSAVDSDPFGESQGGAGFSSDPFAESQGGAGFSSDPFSESQGGAGFSSDPFAESQGGAGFSSDPFAESQGGAGFSSDPFAESQGGAGFSSDPFAESQGGGGFDSNPVIAKERGLEFGPSTETLGLDGGVLIPRNGRSGLDSDPFADKYPEASPGTKGTESNNSSFQDVRDRCTFSSSITQLKSIHGTAPEGNKEVIMPRIHKEPKKSDMSEDEAANQRFGRLYQELDTGKEEDTSAPSFFAEFDKMSEVKSESTETPEASETQMVDKQDIPSAFPAGAEESKSPPGEDPPVEGEGSQAAEVKEHETPLVDEEEKPKCPDNLKEKSDIPAEEIKTSLGEAALSEKMPIPSVVIEPASSNEGDDDRDVDIISPTNISDNGVTTESIKHMSPSGGTSGLPDDFVYKVETMHDFEAANSDELDLKRGDVVLVVPTASVEDQDAGWLTGIKESDWLTLGVGAQRGLFPENFTQRLL